jgi:hypothetical protein
MRRCLSSLEVYQEVLPTTELTMRREELNKRLKAANHGVLSWASKRLTHAFTPTDLVRRWNSANRFEALSGLERGP